MEEQDVCGLVKRFRERMGFTQEQFAQEVGVSFSTAKSRENGKRRPPPFSVRRPPRMEEKLNAKKRNQEGGNRTRR